MYKIILEDNSAVWFNESIIMKIIPNEEWDDNHTLIHSYTLIHFNGDKVIIKDWIKE
jgi:hypothetical protein